MTGSRRFVTFRRGDSSFGVDVAEVRRVLRPSVIQPMSGAAPWVCGKLRVDGRLEVVVDPARLLGRSREEPGETPRVVLVSQERRDFGLLADQVDGVASCDASSVQPPPPFLEDPQTIVRGLALIEDREIFVLDLAPLVGAASGSPAEGKAD